MERPSKPTHLGLPVELRAHILILVVFHRETERPTAYSLQHDWLGLRAIQESYGTSPGLTLMTTPSLSLPREARSASSSMSIPLEIRMCQTTLLE